MLWFEKLRNSHKYEKATVLELDRELTSKSLAAAPGFFMTAAWVAFNRLDSVRYANEILWLSIFLMILALVRFATSYYERKGALSIEVASRITKTNIIINGFVWLATLILPLIEFKLSDIGSSITIVAFIVGFSLSSMVTISYNLLIAFTFQWTMTLPIAVYMFYLSMFENNSAAFHAAGLITIVILYLLNQTGQVHSEIVKRIEYALDLEATNKLLTQSQNSLLEEKAKLQHSIRLAAVGEISGEIAHEINNPLNLIVGYIELSMEVLNSPKKDIEMVQNKLIKARSAITRITKIIKGLRHYSRSAANDPMSPVFVSEIIEDAIEFCSEKFSYNQIELVVEDEVDERILCRSVEISQVLLNIFTNAVDEVSKLPLNDRKIKIKVIKENNILKINISNSGPIIVPDIQEKLFEPFFSTKKVGIGTGLGLSISRNIIESHKGKLFCDSSQPQTTFVIELPVYQ